MGPFYELESSSPAAALKQGESMNHKQYTIHMTCDLKKLDRVSMNIPGISLEKIKEAFRERNLEILYCK